MCSTSCVFQAARVEAVGTEIENPPIKNVASAFGCIGVEARSVDEFKAKSYNLCWEELMELM